MKNSYLPAKEKLMNLDFKGPRPSERDKQFARVFMQEMMMTEEQKVSPDTYGAECFFLRYFVTYEMEKDFPEIAHDFLQHEIQNLGHYTDITFLSDDPIESWPEKAFQNQILNFMMAAVCNGNQYARKLFCYLHKTYYRKEYKILKRFQKISAHEIADIAKDPKTQCISAADVARVLCISKMYGIEISDDCLPIYILLNDEWKESNGHEKPFYNFPEGSITSATDELYTMFADKNEMLEAEFDIRPFIEKVLQYYGAEENFLDLCNDEYMGAEDSFTKTLAMLKICYPKKQFTREDVVIYSQIWNAISALQATCSSMAELVKSSLGAGGDMEYSLFASSFHPEEVEGNTIIRSTTSKKVDRSIRIITPVTAENNKYDEKELLQEIENLRAKVHRQESENKELRKQLKESERKISEHEASSIHFQEDRKELIALRNHVYSMTEGTEFVPEVSIDEMREMLQTKSIMIVGGNDNWVNKLKQIFPNWKYISPNASAAISSMQTARIDRAYFFTDTLAHSQYYKYIQVIRGRELPFGYIHGVNVEANIQQIYKDMSDN